MGTGAAMKTAVCAAVVGVASLMTGCSSGGSSHATVVAPSHATATTAAATAAATPVVGGCRGTDLKGAVASPPEGAAGQLLISVGLQNTGTASCFMVGYPGVSLLDASGQQLGPAATKQPGDQAGKVTINPGGTAYFEIRTSEPEPSNGQGCAARGANLRVYPPDSTESLLVPTSIQICQVFEVRTIQA